jgi:acetyl-CoA synthetase
MVTMNQISQAPTVHRTLRDARDELLRLRTDQVTAIERFSWPALEHFNFALDWFDVVAATVDRTALWFVEEDGSEAKHSYAELSERSDRVANGLRDLGLRRGDRILVMLGNQVELWETMLAAMKLGAVVIPATTLLVAEDVADRIARGKAAHAVIRADLAAQLTLPSGVTSIAAGEPVDGWHQFAALLTHEGGFEPDGPTPAGDPLLEYFTSGTTSQPKLVQHTHTSYPVGHLSTMYWLGLQPGDVHLNLSSPGWAKHAWSCFFAPFLAEATVLVHNYERFDAAGLLGVLERCEATTFCAPPTVWRMLIQADMASATVKLREVVGAGEPLNPEIIVQVAKAWGLTLRDGYGQTETTALVGNAPGQPLKEGSMGRPLPGYDVVLVDPATGERGDQGEICLDLRQRPVGLMAGYRDDDERTATSMRDGLFHTGDVAERDADGYVTFIGRTDDVFKSSDYRISPFELESVLLEHEAVVECAVVPSPDELRLAVPKAFVVLAEGFDADAATAESILAHARAGLAPYKRVRRLEFLDLPKTISGKIRRVELRAREEEAGATSAGERPAGEWSDSDFPGLRGTAT